MTRTCIALLGLALGGCYYNPDAPVTYYVPPPMDYSPTVIAMPYAPAPSRVPVYNGPALQSYDPGYVRAAAKTWNDTPYAPMVAPVARGMPVR